jgi:1,2-diacylglycerol 3-alpha-glucosyltransferase
MKIAIASSGLGHVARGIETWALDTANALHREGVDVTLFAAGHVESEAPLVVVPCIRRRTPLSDLMVRLLPRFTWRWGLQSGYGIEQLTFWWHLKGLLNVGWFDILHIQDPMMADLCRKAREAGRVSVKEILAHGTEEPLEFLSHFEYLQHLAPWHLEQALEQWGECSGFRVPRSEAAGCGELPDSETPNPEPRTPNFSYPFWTAMPNFIDTELYRPVQDAEERRALRKGLGIPEDAFVLGTAAAIKKHHKRIDYLIREFAQFCLEGEGRMIRGQNHSAYLVIAGSKQNDTAELQALAEQLCPGKIKFLINHPHGDMPDLLRCYDAFVLTSIFEMMPIALLEAIATGLPVVTNDHPVLAWMGGDGGVRPDMSQEGALAAALGELTDSGIQRLGVAAREHALANYSEKAVVAQYVAYYEQILGVPG